MEISWFSALCDDAYESLGVPDPALQSIDGRPVDFHGDHLDLSLDPPRVRPANGCPPLYFGGLSENAREVAAQAAAAPTGTSIKRTKLVDIRAGSVRADLKRPPGPRGQVDVVTSGVGRR